MRGRKLPLAFYRGGDVVAISRGLLGKYLCTRINGVLTSGKIVETEAYGGATDRASHAYGNRRTSRTEIMFGEGGVAYVYLCYGIHCLFNVVTNKNGFADAVLVRAVEPMEGVGQMMARRGLSKLERRLVAGPGALSSALGISLACNKLSLKGNIVWIEERGDSIGKEGILESPRVGVDYAGEDARRPWRFRLKGSEWTSPAK